MLGDRGKLLRAPGLVLSGTATVVLVADGAGTVVEEAILAATDSQVSARVAPQLIDRLAALATGAAGSIALARSGG